MQLRLIGLALIITTIFLALAAAATRTTHIRIKQPDSLVIGAESDQALPPQAVSFTSIPILWPLLITGGLGCLLWFTSPSSFRGSRNSSSKRKRVKVN